MNLRSESGTRLYSEFHPTLPCLFPGPGLVPQDIRSETVHRGSGRPVPTRVRDRRRVLVVTEEESLRGRLKWSCRCEGTPRTGKSVSGGDTGYQRNRQSGLSSGHTCHLRLTDQSVEPGRRGSWDYWVMPIPKHKVVFSSCQRRGE